MQVFNKINKINRKEANISQRCSENLDFWRNVQRYKESYAVAAAKSVATKIHNKYLLRYSPDEVNVSGEAKADVGYGVNAGINKSII